MQRIVCLIGEFVEGQQSQWSAKGGGGGGGGHVAMRPTLWSK